jgi:hypothetical protein
VRCSNTPFRSAHQRSFDAPNRRSMNAGLRRGRRLGPRTHVRRMPTGGRAWRGAGRGIGTTVGIAGFAETSTHRHGASERVLMSSSRCPVRRERPGCRHAPHPRRWLRGALVCD